MTFGRVDVFFGSILEIVFPADMILSLDMRHLELQKRISELIILKNHRSSNSAMWYFFRPGKI